MRGGRRFGEGIRKNPKAIIKFIYSKIESEETGNVTFRKTLFSGRLFLKGMLDF